MRILVDKQIVSAAIQAPPMNLVLTFSNQEQLEVLAHSLKEQGVDFPGVVGPAKESEIFSSIWSEMTRKKAHLSMGQKIYKLEKVISPTQVGGKLRVAHANESKTALDFMLTSAKECWIREGSFVYSIQIYRIQPQTKSIKKSVTKKLRNQNTSYFVVMTEISTRCRGCDDEIDQRHQDPIRSSLTRS